MLRVCFIYNENISSKHYEFFATNFELKTLDLTTKQPIIDADFYVLDLKHLTKELSLEVKKLLKTEKPIYFDVPKDFNIMHFQLAILLRCQGILTHLQDTQKVIEKLKNEVLASQANKTVIVQNNEECVNSIETRLGFIEFLKDKLLEENQLYFITLSLKNIVEDQLKELMYEVAENLQDNVQLAQYNGNFYVALFEGNNFEEIQQKAQDLNIQLNHFIENHERNFLSEVYAVDLSGMEFEFILSMLQMLEKNSIPQNLEQKSQIVFIENGNVDQSDEYIISQMLNTISFNKKEVKLLNIYKGIVINSKAQVVKNDDNYIQIALQNLQREVITLQKTTIVEVPGYKQSLEVHMQQVNLKTNIGTFDKYKLIKSSVNARKHGRVTCEQATSIAIAAAGTSIKGNILDISAVSIAIKVPYAKTLEKLHEKDVALSFELELKRNKLAYPISRAARVMRIFVDSEKKVAKLICDFKENYENEHLLMEYIFQRQKNIVREIKKLSLTA